MTFAMQVIDDRFLGLYWSCFHQEFCKNSQGVDCNLTESEEVKRYSFYLNGEVNLVSTW